MISKKQFDEVIKKLSTLQDVEGAIITNNEGLSIASTYTAEETELHAALITALVGRTQRAVSGIKAGELDWFQITTSTHEVYIAPEPNYIVIVMRKRIN